MGRFEATDTHILCVLILNSYEKRPQLPRGWRAFVSYLRSRLCEHEIVHAKNVDRVRFAAFGIQAAQEMWSISCRKSNKTPPT